MDTMMPSPRIVTLGVYGLTESEYFALLQNAKVDLFCDIRQRRGVRGREYAFVNSQRLQARLAELGIEYVHLKSLAPTDAIRQAQVQADKVDKVAKRQRTTLGPAFVQAYRTMILSGFSPEAFLAALPPQLQTIAFFCVERAPEACHRSLVAESFAALGLQVDHL